ncbi:hypothetical protein SAY86_024703 [Trapa natans]|uniref:DUF3598 domain-containing protein n=1 Tax=Trapa natans TaxID=22666 RepID=A0AAN7RJZ9_TRANT|nr:hypothetical protein SAY86_024703 [Trapa natans]
MASICNSSLNSPPNTKAQWNPSGTRPHIPVKSIMKFPRRRIPLFRSFGCRAASSEMAPQSSFADEDPMSLDNLRRFIDLNVGKWNGAFYQFDAKGNLLHKVDTRLSASSYGEDQLISLIQTLYIKQPPSSTSVSGEEDDEPEWGEYKIKETNMFTVDKYQQIGFFPGERAFSLRYQTATMLESVLRQGVLGEDDTGEESPRNLKLPSRRPSMVCENCLYSKEREMRARAFHVMDPKGVIEMLLIFLEEKSDQLFVSPSLANSKEFDGKIIPFLGRWKGQSVTKRSGVYGATIAEAESMASLEMDDKGHLVQVRSPVQQSNTCKIRDA